MGEKTRIETSHQLAEWKQLTKVCKMKSETCKWYWKHADARHVFLVARPLTVRQRKSFQKQVSEIEINENTQRKNARGTTNQNRSISKTIVHIIPRI